MKKLSIGDFIKRGNTVHNNKYDYTKVHYIDISTKVDIICKVHGVFSQKPNDHFLGNGCPKCSTNKKKQTNLVKYGVEWSQHHPDIKNKKTQTNLDRYGSSSPFGSELVQGKIIQTNLERYNGHPTQTKEVQEKKKQTCLKLYGVSNIKQVKINNTMLSLIQDYSWLFDQYITQNKTAMQIANELGIWDTTVGTYLQRHEIEIKQGFWISYKSQLWLNQQEGIIIPEYKIPGTRLRADGYCAATNTIYEFHGDYWHGNPEIYSPEVINEVNGLTMGELYQKTIDRENKIKSLGYNLAVIWEKKWNDL